MVLRGDIAEELLHVMTGDKPTSADLYMGQMPRRISSYSRSPDRRDLSWLTIGQQPYLRARPAAHTQAETRTLAFARRWLMGTPLTRLQTAGDSGAGIILRRSSLLRIGGDETIMTLEDQRVTLKFIPTGCPG